MLQPMAKPGVPTRVQDLRHVEPDARVIRARLVRGPRGVLRTLDGSSSSDQNVAFICVC